MEEISGQEVREREHTQLNSEHQVMRTMPDTGTADAALALMLATGQRMKGGIRKKRIMRKCV